MSPGFLLLGDAFRFFLLSLHKICPMKNLTRCLFCLTVCAAAMFARAAVVDELDFCPLGDMPVLGTLAPDASVKYTRLPDSLKEKVREDLWNLGQNSAGISVRFRTDSHRLAARWHSRLKFNMNHMTATGIRGLDLYVRDGDKWTTLSSARPSFNSHNSTSLLVADMEPGVMREYMLYLSLYDGVDSLFIGVDSSAVVLPPALNLPKHGKPIVMYGTSILQGGCASRPGMAHTNILQRELDREVVNLGFSGNGRLDYEIARLIADNDVSMVIIDALPNCKAADLDENLAEFVAIIRRKHPAIPIVLVESPMFPIHRFDREVHQTLTDKNNHLRAIYQWLVDEGDRNLYLFPSEKTLGNLVEGTVDNYHYTDYGFQAYADELLPVIRKLLKD